jgi:prophage antirepressor-like protein
MNALIDLGKCREHMTVEFNEKKYRVKLSGTIKQPYFCGKDLCDILDHKDSKYALKTHVPLKYKKELSYFYGQNNQNRGGGGGDYPHKKC